MVDDVSRMSDAAELIVSNLSSNQSYKNMKKTRKLMMGAFKEILKEKHLSNDAIESCCDDYATWTIERDMNNMKKLASCPTGYLVVFFCDCKRVNRRSSAWCRCGRKHITSCDTDGCAARSMTYQEGSCVHLDRDIASDECVQYFAYYPVWNYLFDLIQSNTDEFFTCCTRKQLRHSSRSNFGNRYNKVISFQKQNTPDQQTQQEARMEANVYGSIPERDRGSILPLQMINVANIESFQNNGRKVVMRSSCMMR